MKKWQKNDFSPKNCISFEFLFIKNVTSLLSNSVYRNKNHGFSYKWCSIQLLRLIVMLICSLETCVILNHASAQDINMQ